MIRIYFICLTLLTILALPVTAAVADDGQKEEMTAPTPGEIKGLWMIGDGSKIVKIDECRDMPFEPKWSEDALTPDFFHRKYLRQKRDWQHDITYAFLVFTADHDEKMIGAINIAHVQC